VFILIWLCTEREVQRSKKFSRQSILWRKKSEALAVVSEATLVLSKQAMELLIVLLKISDNLDKNVPWTKEVTVDKAM